MAFRHEMQSSRYEMKYQIDERRAAAVREFCSGYLVPDEYADPNNNNSYRISSIYLDGPDLPLFRQTSQGIKNRFKLRIRFYDDDQGHPACLEIKRRINEVIRKERAVVHREAVADILKGACPKPTLLVKGAKDVKGQKALVNFCDLRDAVQAQPWIFVSYVREAYVSPESNDLRLTFDRGVYGSPYDQGPLCIPCDGASAEMGPVILEIKFSDRFPAWMHHLAMSCNLYRTTAAKYNSCIEALQPIPESGRMGVKRSLAIGSLQGYL